MHSYQRISLALRAEIVEEAAGGDSVRVFVATTKCLQLKPLAITVFWIKDYAYYLADHS
jgi:hypothetical protein